MADLPLRDGSVDSTNGVREGQRARLAGTADLVGAEQTLADSEQTLAEATRTSVQPRATTPRPRAISRWCNTSCADAHRLDVRAISAVDVVLRAAEQRRDAARHRVDAAEHRALAAEDRRAALADREQAARDRLQALADREALARQLAIAETDALTGVRTRAAGLADLDHELDRCRRNGGSLVVSYVDVVGLKAINDSRGHAAGDELLKHVVTVIRSQLRSYDLIVRLGGDEFLCAMSNIALAAARERFDLVSELLADSTEAGPFGRAWRCWPTGTAHMT